MVTLRRHSGDVKTFKMLLRQFLSELDGLVTYDMTLQVMTSHDMSCHVMS